MRIGSERGFATGVLFLVIGAGAAGLAATYDLHRGSQIGPGYFPLWLGLLLVLLGIGNMVAALRIQDADRERLERWDLRVLLVILGSVAAFALLLRPLGLALTMVAVVVISSFAEKGPRLVPTIAVAILLSAANTLIFVYGLRLPIQVWPVFVSG